MGAEIVCERAILRKLISPATRCHLCIQPVGRQVSQILDEAESRISRSAKKAHATSRVSRHRQAGGQPIDRVNELAENGAEEGPACAPASTTWIE